VGGLTGDGCAVFELHVDGIALVDGTPSGDLCGRCALDGVAIEDEIPSHRRVGHACAAHASLCAEVFKARVGNEVGEFATHLDAVFLAVGQRLVHRLDGLVDARGIEAAVVVACLCRLDGCPVLLRTLVGLVEIIACAVGGHGVAEFPVGLDGGIYARHEVDQLDDGLVDFILWRGRGDCRELL